MLHPEQALLGLAVDIGTTKMAAYLLDLATGHTLAKGGLMNPQIAYGEDVVSRIAYANRHPDGRHLLQTRLIESLNDLINLCQSRANYEQIVEACGQYAIITFAGYGAPVAKLFMSRLTDR